MIKGNDFDIIIIDDPYKDKPLTKKQKKKMEKWYTEILIHKGNVISNGKNKTK